MSSNKHGGYLTPKAIANRMKAKGLQKLRWYCQMCKKQCRDANGFKCHKTSEGHQRMMKIFRENRGTILDNFSREFESGFMDLVRRRWRTKRVFANKVYNEYISDRHHVHMNATIWESLTSFVKYLGRTKQCDVDQTEKGWYVKYIDRDPDIIAQQEAQKRKEKMDLSDELKCRKRIERMIELTQQETGLSGTELETETETAETGDLETSETAETAETAEAVENSETAETGESMEIPEKIQFKIGTPAQPTVTAITVPIIPATVAPKKLSIFTGDNDDDGAASEEITDPNTNEKKRKYDEDSSNPKKKQKIINTQDQRLQQQRGSALEELTTSIMKKQILREQEMKKKLQEKDKQQQQQEQQSTLQKKDYWLIPGIIVKVLNKKVGNGAYYGKKGVVSEVLDLYVGVIKMIDNNHLLKIDQAHLETVLPTIGGCIAIVNGQSRGYVGILEGINVDKYKAIVKVDDAIIEKDYEDVCKIFSGE